MKKIIFALYTFIIVNVAYSQNFTETQLTTIDNSVKELLSNFEKYGTLTEDGRKISENYVAKFSQLFDTVNVNAKEELFNDINPESTGEENLTLNEYLSQIRANFPTGISVKIQNIQTTAPVFDDEKAVFAAMVKADKLLIGLYKGKKVHTVLNSLYFRIEFVEITENVYDEYKISGIYNKPFIVKKRKPRDKEITYYASVNYSNLIAPGMFLADQTSSQRRVGYSVGLKYNYFIGKTFGISAGLGHSVSNSQFAINNYYSEYTTVDSDTDTYLRKIYGSDIVENHSLIYVELPVNLNARFSINQKITIITSAGMYFQYALIKSLKSEGTYTYKGYYPELNVELQNLPEFGFNTNEKFSFKGNLDAASINFSAYGSVKFAYQYNWKSSFYVGFNYFKGLTSIQGKKTDNYHISTEKGNYTGITNSGTGLFTGSIGLELGLILKLL